MPKREEATMEQPDMPRREYHTYKDEYSVAYRVIKEVITPELKSNPKLNLCVIRQFCEIMVHTY